MMALGRAIAVLAGLASIALTRPPDPAIAEIDRFVAVRTHGGHYAVAGGRGEAMPVSFLAKFTGAPARPASMTETEKHCRETPASCRLPE
jgi:hypothetical protein